LEQLIIRLTPVDYKKENLEYVLMYFLISMMVGAKFIKGE
jgi:hypothetical protein